MTSPVIHDVNSLPSNDNVNSSRSSPTSSRNLASSPSCLGFSMLHRPNPTPTVSSRSPKANCHMGRAGHHSSNQSKKVTRLFGCERNSI